MARGIWEALEDLCFEKHWDLLVQSVMETKLGNYLRTRKYNCELFSSDYLFVPAPHRPTYFSRCVSCRDVIMETLSPESFYTSEFCQNCTETSDLAGSLS